MIELNSNVNKEINANKPGEQADLVIENFPINKNQNGGQIYPFGYQQMVLNAFSPDFGKPIVAGIPINPSPVNTNSPRNDDPHNPMNNNHINNNNNTNNYNHLFNNSIHIPHNDSRLILKLDLETQIRNDARWFTGCNSFWALILFISVIVKIVNMVNLGQEEEDDKHEQQLQNDNQEIAVIYVIQYIIWFISCIFGVQALSSFRINLLDYYGVGMFLSMILEFVGGSLLIKAAMRAEIDYGTYLFTTVVTIVCQICFIYQGIALKKLLNRYQREFISPSFIPQMQIV